MRTKILNTAILMDLDVKNKLFKRFSFLDDEKFIPVEGIFPFILWTGGMSYERSNSITEYLLGPKFNHSYKNNTVRVN